MIRRPLPVLITTVFLLVLAFQACQPSSSNYNFSKIWERSASGTGNGEGFEGKIEWYAHFDTSHPCSDLGPDGRPLPNGQILMTLSAFAQTAMLVRQGCVDVVPHKELDLSEIQMSADGSLIYQRNEFQPSPQPTAVLSLDFTENTSLPSDIAWSRSTSATYCDSTGLIASAPAHRPRFDYDPETHTLRGLLMERSSSNVLLTSGALTDPSWSTSNMVVTRDAEVAPDGTMTASLFTETAAKGGHRVAVNPAWTYAPGTPVAFSIFIKPVGRKWVFLQIQEATTWTDNMIARFDVSGKGSVAYVAHSGSGSDPIARITPYPNGWYRIEASGVVSTSKTNIEVDLYLESPEGVRDYAGESGGGFHLWGAQLEAGPSTTSYIATTNVPVTRGADSAQFNSLAWYSESTGTLFAEYVNLADESSAAYRVFGLYQDNGGSFSSNEISLSDSGALGAGALARGGSPIFNPSGNLNADGRVNRQALAYASGSFAYSGNGVVPSTSSTGAVPTGMAYATVGSQPDGGMRSRYIRRIQYFDKRLPDVVLQQMTR